MEKSGRNVKPSAHKVVSPPLSQLYKEGMMCSFFVNSSVCL